MKWELLPGWLGRSSLQSLPPLFDKSSFGHLALSRHKTLAQDEQETNIPAKTEGCHADDYNPGQASLCEEPCKAQPDEFNRNSCLIRKEPCGIRLLLTKSGINAHDVPACSETPIISAKSDGLEDWDFWPRGPGFFFLVRPLGAFPFGAPEPDSAWLLNILSSVARLEEAETLLSMVTTEISVSSTSSSWIIWSAGTSS